MDGMISLTDLASRWRVDIRTARAECARRGIDLHIVGGGPERKRVRVSLADVERSDDDA